MAKLYDLGVVQIGSEITVSDPVFRYGSRLQKQLTNVYPGDYRCTAEMIDIGEKDYRVSALEAVHDHYDCDFGPDSESFQIGVDGGQAGIFDSVYYQKNHTEQEWYDFVCDITLDRNLPAGITHHSGCVSSSGIGDGFYNVYVHRNSNSEIIGIRIEFLVEEDVYEDFKTE